MKTESRFSFLWGFYKRASSETHVYSSWCWGAFTFVRARLAVEKAAEPPRPRGRVIGHYTSFVGMQDLRDLFSGRITAEEYSKKKGPLFESGPVRESGLMLSYASTPRTVTVPATVAHAHRAWSERTRGNPSAPALEAQGGWEDDPDEDLDT